MNFIMSDLQEKLDEFKNHVPISDATLMILKSHLIIERRILEYIKERVNEEIYSEISKQREGAYQSRVLLAHALSCRDEIPSSNNHIIWPALRQLGKLRNQIAHNLDHKGSSLEDKMRDFIKKVDHEGKVLSITPESVRATAILPQN